MNTVLERLRQHPRALLAASAGAALLLIVTAIGLTEILRLNPCHLCILQRLLDIGLLLFFALAAWRYRHADRRLWLLLAVLVALTGMAVAGFQSWEQWYPEASPGCTGVEPNAIERLVEWLGARWPRLFLATGFCDSVELLILGLSLANWSFVSFAGFALASAILLFKPAFFTGARPS